MFSIKQKAAGFTLIIVLSAFCLSFCSQSAPEIIHGSLELVYYENGGRPVERFTFFILPHDNDGIEDLEDLWLYHDWEGLSWHLTGKDWIKETAGGDIWIGSRSISMEDSSSLPRGQFRAVLADKGGNRTERLFTFDAPSIHFAERVKTNAASDGSRGSLPAGDRPFPHLTISANRYRIESGFPEQNLLVYDNEGNYLSTVIPSSLEGYLSELGLPSQATSLALWARDQARSVSAFTDIVPLHD